ncbi:hypothetical protein [Paraliomyxa miuraensis]|uniref:hypothetical protein n=1 Tax=Paraliomyxa miuraensis TaxID=376150 RepID=UPI0022501F60|nr:hypothetical protein [Paraliomyxa miuraensis]MCX4241702.1 hypothetical protein [Paraliomyxa miuraensis]
MSDIDVSLILPLRDQEAETAATVRVAAEIAARARLPEGYSAGAREALEAEILALDQRSGDNTLSVLSLLHGKIPSLRTLQDVEPGQAIRRATRVARGAVWLVMDHPIDPELGAWGVGQVFRGHRAAIIPGEMLVVDQPLGITVLPRLPGGLVSAQQAVTRHLRGQNLRPVWSPPSKKGPIDRARLFVRGQLGRFGLGWLDRPGVLD